MRGGGARGEKGEGGEKRATGTLPLPREKAGNEDVAPPGAGVTWGELAVSYLRVGCLAFGGGLASLPVFKAELCDRRGWMSEEELAGWFGAAQVVPGVILVNVSATTGLRLKGRRGAVLAAVAAVAPAVAVMLGVGWVWLGYGENRWVAGGLKGLRGVVVGMLAAVAVRLGAKAWAAAGAWGWAVMAGTAAWMMGGGSPVPVILATVGGGALGGWARARRERKGGG